MAENSAYSISPIRRSENKEKQLDGRVLVTTEKRRAAEELKKFLRVLESERKTLEDKIYRII